MPDLELEQWRRWERMPERERAALVRLGVQPPTDPTPRRLKYNPHTKEGWSGFWKTVDDNHFAAMREYYTRDKDPDPVWVGDVEHQPKKMLALMAGPQPFGVLTV